MTKYLKPPTSKQKQISWQLYEVVWWKVCEKSLLTIGLSPRIDRSIFSLTSSQCLRAAELQRNKPSTQQLCSTLNNHLLHLWKLTWHWKISCSNRKTSSFMVDFHGHTSFFGGLNKKKVKHLLSWMSQGFLFVQLKQPFDSWILPVLWWIFSSCCGQWRQTMATAERTQRPRSWWGGID